MGDTNAVKVTLDEEIVHRCATVTEAEEWIAENGDRSRSNDYKIDAPRELADQFVEEGEGTLTETGVETPADNIALLRSTITDLVDLIDSYRPTMEGAQRDEFENAVKAGRAALDAVDPGLSHPYLKAFDEIATQGRTDLQEFLKSGAEEQSALLNIIAEMQDGPVALTSGEGDRRRPMLLADAHRFLRRSAGQLVRAVGMVPLVYAIPGLRDLIVELDDAVMAPALEDYRSGAFEGTKVFELMSRFTATFDDYVNGDRTVPAAEVQRVAKELHVD